jgi:hypothetical protein
VHAGFVLAVRVYCIKFKVNIKKSVSAPTENIKAKENVMKRINLTVLVVFCISLFAIQCSQDSNPVGPGVSTQTQSGDAVLLGNFVTSGTSSVDFGLIQVSIKGTNIQAQPDPNGDFQINGLPTGNQSVEVNVENCLSFIDVADIQSGEEIRMQLQIQENNCVMLQNMNRNKKSAVDLQLEIRPKKWNIDWVNSMDEGNARIYGAGFDTIDSVVITGPSGIVIPDIRTEIGGVYYKAFFNQRDAIASILDPKRGDPPYVITVTVTFTQEVNKPSEDLTDKIEIVGAKSEPEEPEEDLVMDINPRKWNTNWIKSNGYVTVRFRGAGFETIGATSMSYNDNGGTPIYPFRDSISDSCYSAKFNKKDAIGLFLNPQKGETYWVTVQFDDGSIQTETYPISIVGSKK